MTEKTKPASRLIRLKKPTSASPNNKSTPPVKKSSRFLQTNIEAVAAELERRNQRIPPPEADAELKASVSKLEKKIRPKMRDLINDVETFMLQEIMPLTVSNAAGSRNAKTIAERFLGSQIDDLAFNAAARMTNAAVNIKLARYVAERFGLPEECVPILYAASSKAATVTADDLLTRIQKMVDKNA